MNETFDRWFNRFMFATEIIFLLASMPHIAAWFAHFDSMGSGVEAVYAWSIGFALAFAIDGVSFMVLLAITRMVREGKTRSFFVMLGLLLFLFFIAVLSGFINWQYDVEYASTTFGKADSIALFGTSVGALNPAIGGSFQILILVYTLISKAVTVKEETKEELQEKLTQLRETKTLKEQIREQQEPKKSLIQRAKNAALEVTNAVIEVRNSVNSKEETEQIPERNTDHIGVISSEENKRNFENTLEETALSSQRKARGNALEFQEEFDEEKDLSWLSTGGTTIPLQTVVEHTKIGLVRLRNRVESKEIRATKNKDIVYKDSLIAWLKREGILKESPKIVHLKVVGEE